MRRHTCGKVAFGRVLTATLRAAAFAVFVFFACGTAQAWQELEPGLALGEFHAPLNDPEDDTIITVLRIDPAFFSFQVLMAYEHGDPRTLDSWADDFELVAAINASMYLPNNRTSTGLMRCGNHLNNGTINSRFGAFFMAGPKREGIPSARIVDRTQHDWRAALEDYSCVVQNYRMISPGGKIHWQRDSNTFSIASIGEDHAGNILFIHSRTPFSVHDFSASLLALPLDLKSAMYAEGGREAALYVRSRLMTKSWSGGYSSFLFGPGQPKLLPLPNVLGIIRAGR